MSFQAIRWALAQELPGTEKIVLIALADFHNHKSGRCNPSKTALAGKAGVCQRAADRMLIRLRERGLIDFELSKGWQPNQYTLNTPHVVHGNTPHNVQGTRSQYPVPESEYPVPQSEYPVPGTPKPVITSKNQGGAHSHKKNGERTTSTRGTRIPVKSLPDEWRAYAETKHPDINPESVFESFKDHWLAAPGQKGVKADWLATWRNWLRREQGFRRDTGKGQADGYEYA